MGSCFGIVGLLFLFGFLWNRWESYLFGCIGFFASIIVYHNTDFSKSKQQSQNEVKQE